MMPFEPQQFEEVKARFPVALMSTYDCRSGIPSPTPGELRAHVFDFTDGLRLIVSRDKFESRCALYSRICLCHRRHNVMVWY